MHLNCSQCLGEINIAAVAERYKQRVAEKYGRLAPLAPIFEAPLPYKIAGGVTVLALLFILLGGKK